MSKKSLWLMVGGSVALLIAGIVYTVFCNDSRLIAPTDWSTYVFHARDLALILPILLLAAVLVFAVVTTLRTQKQVQSAEQRYTRTISPKLGLLGFFGFLGFLGLLPLEISGVPAIPYPYLFFAFFGFFGFYYEGKMSHILMDERYQVNALRAQAAANALSLKIIVLATIFAVSIFRIHNAYALISVLFSVIGLAFGLTIFLSNYLLYRYDCEE